jgi:DNA-directed RNA polymerase subunit RPC12/RpoP
MKRNQQRQLLVYLAAFAVLAVIGFAVLLATGSFVRVLALVMLIATGLLLIVDWHARTFAYRCRICGHEFEISFWTDLFNPHWPSRDGGWKYLKCPACRRRTKAIVIEKAKTART